MVILRGPGSRNGPRTHHADHGNDIFLLELVHGKGAGRIAGYHDSLYIFAQQEIHDLPGITDDRIFRLRTIGHPGRIAEIDQALIGELSHDLPGYGKPPDP